MKAYSAIALLLALAVPAAFADDAAVKPSASKPAFTTPSGHRLTLIDDDSAAERDTNDPYGYDMMERYSVDAMMEANMRTLGTLGLNLVQKAAINTLSDEFKHNIWVIQGFINDETTKLRYLYEADRRDPAAIGKEYMKVFDLKRQLIEAYLDTQNRIEDVLTPEQRTKVKAASHEMHRIYGHPLK